MKDRRQQASYVAETIATFIDGTGGTWDWDDFTSSRLSDPTLDGIRRRALAVILPVDDHGEAVLHGLLAEAEQLAALDS